MSDYFDELEKLKTWGFFEIYQRTAFKSYRESKSGDVEHIAFEIFDRGPNHPATRYHIVATRDDSKSVTGNPSHSLADALNLVHWWALDEPQNNQQSLNGPIDVEGSETEN